MKRLFFAVLIVIACLDISIVIRRKLEAMESSKAKAFAVERLGLQKAAVRIRARTLNRNRGDFLVTYERPPFAKLEWTVNLPQGLVLAWQSPKKESSLLKRELSENFLTK